MLASLKKFFSRKVDYHVETYGKLPCYKDYISVITTGSAAQWRAWLLESFQGKIMPPEGIWPFIYQHSKSSDLVVGVIKPSSDGLRQFPFTLFVVCSKRSRRGGLCSRPLAHSIWQELVALDQQLIGAEDIQAFYARFYGKKISPSVDTNNSTEDDQEFSCNREGEWPRMLVAETSNARMLHLVRDGITTNEEFVLNWQGLHTNDTLVPPPICTQDKMSVSIGADADNPPCDALDEGHRKESPYGEDVRAIELRNETVT